MREPLLYVCLVSLGAALTVAAASRLAPVRHVALPSSAISASEARRFTVELAPIAAAAAFPFPFRLAPTDDVERPRTAPHRLFEDDVQLVPAHAPLAEIAGTGGGAHSFWGTTLFFSSSDGRDPRSSGRRYEVELVGRVPRRAVQAGWIAAAAALASALALAWRRWPLSAGAHMQDRAAPSGAASNGPELGIAGVLARRSTLARPRRGVRLRDPWLWMAIVSGGIIVAGWLLLPTPAPVRTTIAPSAFVRQDANRFAVGLAPFFAAADLRFPFEPGPTDDSAQPSIAAHRLYENDVPLGPPHALHAEIATIGRGRHSFWGGHLLLSTSDNSDPATNGRRYEIVVAPRLHRSVVAVAVLLALVPLGYACARVRGRPLARRGGWLAAAALVATPFVVWFVPRAAIVADALPPILIVLALAAATVRFIVRRLPPSIPVAVAARLERIARVAGWRATRRAGLPIVLGFVVTSLLRCWAPLPPPPHAWPGARTCSMIRGRFLVSDAMDYWACSQWMRWNDDFPTFAQRRPLNSTLLAAESVFGDGQPQLVLLCGALLAAASMWCLSVAVGRWLGLWAAVATFAVVLGYVQHFVGLTLSESLGATLGACGAALLLEGARRSALWPMSIGAAALTLALLARAGAFFALPAILLAIAFTEWSRGGASDGRPARFRRAARAALCVGVAVACAVAINHSLFTLTTDGTSSPNGNFAYVLFGLASGGDWTIARDWLVAHVPPTDERTQSAALYAEALDRIRAAPSVFVGSLLRSLGGFATNWGPGISAHFADHGLLGAGLIPTVVWGLLGPITLLRRARRGDAAAVLTLAAITGILASMLVIWTDGSWRAVAPTLPLMAAASCAFLGDPIRGAPSGAARLATGSRRRRPARLGALWPSSRLGALWPHERLAALIALGVPLAALAAATGAVARHPGPPPVIDGTIEPGADLVVPAPRAQGMAIVGPTAEFTWFGPTRLDAESFWREIDAWGQPAAFDAIVPRAAPGAEAAMEPVALIRCVLVGRALGFGYGVLVAPAEFAALAGEPLACDVELLGHIDYLGPAYRLRTAWTMDGHVVWPPARPDAEADAAALGAPPPS